MSNRVNAKIFNSDDDIRIEKNEKGEDVYILDPYNPLNKEIQKEEVERILRAYGIDAPITNLRLYQRAFVNDSYIRRPDVENASKNIKIFLNRTIVCRFTLYPTNAWNLWATVLWNASQNGFCISVFLKNLRGL